VVKILIMHGIASPRRLQAQVGFAVTNQTCIRKVPSSNIGGDTAYPEWEFPNVSSFPPGKDQDISFVCFVFHALIWSINVFTKKQIHFNLIDTLLLYYSHLHVSVIHPAILGVISLITRIQL
jgi:hypothetical protein